MNDILVTAPLAGWLTPLGDVPDPVFAGRLIGDGIAIDPTGDTLFAPCDAMLLSIHPAGHAVTLQTEAGAELLIHVGVDTVSLGGPGFTAIAAPGRVVLRGDPLLKFDLDLLVRTAPAVVTPVLVTDLDRFSIEPVAGEGRVAVGDPLFRIVARSVTAQIVDGVNGPTMRRDVHVALAHGVHARPAARLAASVRGFSATVTLVHGERRAPARSTVGVLGLGAGHGALLTIEAAGPDAVAALDAVAAILLDAAPEAAEPPSVTHAVPDDEPGLRGVAAAPGLAIGPATWLRRDEIVVPEAGEGPEIEARRLDAALRAVHDDLTAKATEPGARGAVLAAHIELFDDPVMIERTRADIAVGRSAAAAYRAAIAEQVAVLAASGDRRIAERADDLRDVEGRMLRFMLDLPPAAPATISGGILLARELLPSDMIALDPAAVAGIALIEGGPTSHVAILAAGMGIPMAVAFGAALADVGDGTALVLDADRGLLTVDPPAAHLDATRAELSRRRAGEAAARAAGSAPCYSADGVRIEVFANLASAADAVAAVAEGAEGCGLLRTEFLFLDRADPPTIAEQTADYQAIADALETRPLVVRLLDVGGDKPAPYLSIAPEENPALGLRGIRVALARPEILDAQLRAILSVVPQGRCRIMVPMVASVAELDAVADAVAQLCGELGITAPIEVGAMVETPAAAMCADLLARRAAFLSIGSNDLTQYALAMDRGNPAVAAGIDGLHPAVLRLIAATCDGAAGQPCPVGVCGGLAADPLSVPILLGLGITELSVPPARIAATKALVARLSLSACRAHAAAMLALSSPQKVRAAAAVFARDASTKGSSV